MAVEHWLTLSMTRGLGPVLSRRIVEAAGSAEAACDAGHLAGVEGIGERKALMLKKGLRDGRAAADAQLDKADRLGLTILSPDCDDWPPLLVGLADAPLVLWAWGGLEPRDLHAVSIVGSRRPTGYGREQAKRFAYGFANNGLTVVSGGAYGVDTHAHRGALDAQGGRTLVVLGCGCDVAYPPENEQLFEEVADGRGAVISELPPGTQPRREHFPRRNRVISGLSRGVVVIEAAERSGALITARVAADDHNRPVFALPGRVDNDMALGPLGLLRDGARLALSPEQVADELDPLPFSAKQPTSLKPQADLFTAAPPVASPPPPTRTIDHPDEQAIVDALADGPLGADALCERTGLAASAITSRLTLMSLRTLVRRVNGNQYERV